MAVGRIRRATCVGSPTLDSNVCDQWVGELIEDKAKVFEQANASLDRLGLVGLLRDAGLDGLEHRILDSFGIRSDEDPVLVAESWQSAVASVLGLS